MVKGGIYYSFHYDKLMIYEGRTRSGNYSLLDYYSDKRESRLNYCGPAFQWDIVYIGEL